MSIASRVSIPLTLSNQPGEIVHVSVEIAMQVPEGTPPEQQAMIAANYVETILTCARLGQTKVPVMFYGMN